MFLYSMQQYQVPSASISTMIRQFWKKYIPTFLLVPAIGVAVVLYANNGANSNTGSLLLIIPIMAIVLGLSAYRGSKKQRLLLESYRLTVTGNLLTREQANTPEITIYFNEVTAITQYKNKSLLVRGKTATDYIVIPYGINDYEGLVATLSAIRPITPPKINNRQRMEIAGVLITVIALIAVYTLTNKIIVGISGVVAIILLVRGFYAVQTNKNIDRNTKRGLWWSIIVIVSVCMIVFYKLRA